MGTQRPLRDVTILVISLLSSGASFADSDMDEDLFDLSLEELMSFEVTVASLFPETLLESSSTVSVITESDWLEVFGNVQNLLNRENRLPSVLLVEDGIEAEPISASIGVRYTL